MVAISDGSKLGTKSNPVEMGTTAEVLAPLPSGWVTGENSASLITDINGDGFPDFCLGKAITNLQGAVAVYW